MQSTPRPCIPERAAGDPVAVPPPVPVHQQLPELLLAVVPVPHPVDAALPLLRLPPLPRDEVAQDVVVWARKDGELSAG